MAPVSLESGDVSKDTTQQQQHDGTPQADGDTNFDVDIKEVTDFEQKEKDAETQSIPQRYEVQQTLGEGTFAIVYKALDTKNDNRVVAIKRIKLSESEEARNGIDHGALREIRYMQEVTHVNVLKLLDVYGHGKEISLVFDFMVTDLQKIINDRSYLFSPGDVKSYMLQTMTGLECLHANWILHRVYLRMHMINTIKVTNQHMHGAKPYWQRCLDTDHSRCLNMQDLKPDNLLISATGVLKIADFGLARDFGTPNMNYTSHVVTLWYRAPELLLGAKSYGTAVDVWSCGCIMAELLQRAPFLPGEDDWRQLLKIFQVLGSPSSDEWPEMKSLPAYKPPHPSPRVPFNVIFGGATKEALSLLEGMFTYYPAKRFTATQCLQHPYFSSLPAPTPPAYLPGADTEAALRGEAEAHQQQQNAHDHTQQLAQADKRQGSPADDEPPAKRLKK